MKATMILLLVVYAVLLGAGVLVVLSVVPQIVFLFSRVVGMI